MKKIQRMLALFLVLLMLLSATACSSSNVRDELNALKDAVARLEAENESLKQQAIANREELANQKTALEALQKDSEDSFNTLEDAIMGRFRVRVFDIDGELLVDAAASCTEVSSLAGYLTEQHGMVSYASDYGTTVVSIAGSVVDANYYVSISENGSYAQTGIDGLKLDAGDLFEFKVECWNTVESGFGTMDEYDVLVDQLVYSYLKKTLPEKIAAATAYTDALYWDQAAIEMMRKYDYDLSLLTPTYTDVYRASVQAVDPTTLSGNEFMKYDYACRALDITPAGNFVVSFQAAVATSCTDWLLPLAKDLRVDTDGVRNLLATPPDLSMTMGPDASILSYVLRGIYQNYEGYLAKYTETLDWGNGTSCALVLLAFAKDGVDPRGEAYQKQGKDILETLLDTYYDESLGIVKVYPDDTGLNFSSNQIYASLMAYKAWRDTGSAVNIFA